MEEKKVKKLYIIIILLCLVIVGMGVYIICNKKPNNTNNIQPTPTPQKNVEVLPKDTVIAKAEYMLDNAFGSSIEYSGFYSFLKGYKGTINDFPNQTKLQIVYWMLRDGIGDKDFEQLTSDEILSYFRKLFGSDYNIVFEDIKVLGYDDIIAWKYNKDTKTFEDAGTGRETDYDFVRIIKSKFIKFSEVEEGKYVLTFKQLFNYDQYHENNKNCFIFTNFEGKKIFTKDCDLYEGTIEHSKDNVEKVVKEEFSKYEKELTEVDYTFEVENGELVLKGINY